MPIGPSTENNIVDIKKQQNCTIRYYLLSYLLYIKVSMYILRSNNTINYKH